MRSTFSANPSRMTFPPASSSGVLACSLHLYDTRPRHARFPVRSSATNPTLRPGPERLNKNRVSFLCRGGRSWGAAPRVAGTGIDMSRCDGARVFACCVGHRPPVVRARGHLSVLLMFRKGDGAATIVRSLARSLTQSVTERARGERGSVSPFSAEEYPLCTQPREYGRPKSQRQNDATQQQQQQQQSVVHQTRVPQECGGMTAARCSTAPVNSRVYARSRYRATIEGRWKRPQL
jgi:hypothetical protein